MDDALRNGRNGNMPGFVVRRDLCDAVGGVIYAGVSDIQRNIVKTLNSIS